MKNHVNHNNQINQSSDNGLNSYTMDLSDLISGTYVYNVIIDDIVYKTNK